MNTSLEIYVLASRIDSDIFETIKQEVINHNLKYEEDKECKFTTRATKAIAL